MNGDDLRRRLAEGTPVVMPGAWDVLSARLAHRAGFDTVFLSGYCTSATLLGRPDTGFLTQTEMADVALRVCHANPDLMVVVDADTGWGNALNAIRTVELWEQAGATGMFLEDQVWPKRCGHMGGKQVIAREEWLAKLRAALDHRSTLFLTARTDARASDGIQEAIERVKMAVDLGVDAVFVEAPESISELEQISEALPGAVRVANMIETGKTPLLTPSELHEIGFDLIVSPLTALFSATRAMADSLATLREEGTMRSNLDRLVSFDAFGEIVGYPHQQALEERYT